MQITTPNTDPGSQPLAAPLFPTTEGVIDSDCSSPSIPSSAWLQGSTFGSLGPQLCLPTIFPSLSTGKSPSSIPVPEAKLSPSCSVFPLSLPVGVTIATPYVSVMGWSLAGHLFLVRIGSKTDSESAAPAVKVKRIRFDIPGHVLDACATTRGSICLYISKYPKAVG